PTGTFSQVATGPSGSWCGIRTDGSILCAGVSGAPTSGSYTQLTLGSSHACALARDATVVCWGGNASGQLAVPSDTYLLLNAGYDSTCAVTTTGAVRCWGDNSSGKSVPPSGTFTRVAVGKAHACAVRTDGSIGCWGANESG